MTEGIVTVVLNNLKDAAVKEALSFFGAGDKLESLQHELRWIRAFLKDAETKQNLDERTKTWVSDVREVAHRIEDVADMFMAEVDGRNRPGMTNVLKRVLSNPKKLPIVHKLNSEIDAIQTRLLQIKELTDKYSISRVLGESSSALLTRRPIREAMLNEDDPDVIGLETDKENIVNLLLDPNTTRRCVVSIIGQGGLGKTTLAKKAYNSDEVKRAFKFRCWLSVSQEYKLIDLLKMMLEDLRPLNENEKDLLQPKDLASQQRAKEHFIWELNILLKDKRYLIVMDDVWKEDFWIQIEKALPNVSNGSRALVTTRFSKIARKADPICEPYNLRFLSEAESLELFLKKAFPYQDPKIYLPDILDLPEKFVKKCDGLPLALVVVGSLLSEQQPTYNAWHRILNRFNWQYNDDGKKCMEILATSYEDMPAHLKPCFMYFASFPEDYEIKAKPLIRLWVSEGFIPEINDRTMEETAEDYLDNLVQRSMIQVSRRYLNGSIKICHIHDLLRDLAIEKAKENNFLQTIPNKRDRYYIYTPVRRATLHSNCEDIMKYTGPNLRSILYFGNDQLKVGNFRYLKVLCRMTTSSKLNISKDMSQLRYLINFNNNDKEFWKSISRMRNLQTLHLNYFQYGPWADCIWNIKTLRHVILKGHFPGPPSMADLPNLQTLKTVMVRKEWLAKGWPKMPNIRTLKFTDLSQKYEESLRTFLSRLHHLTSLGVKLSELEGTGLMDMSACPHYNYIQSLCVEGSCNLEKTMNVNALDLHLLPLHLIKLNLRFSHMKVDQMPTMEKLKSLRKFILFYAYDGKQLSCSAGGFPRLEYLEFYSLKYLEEWKVEKGGMPLLKEICISYCDALVKIPELQHMTSLNKLTLKRVHPDLHNKLGGEESYKIQHIPFIEM